MQMRAVIVQIESGDVIMTTTLPVYFDIYYLREFSAWTEVWLLRRDVFVVNYIISVWWRHNDDNATCDFHHVLFMEDFYWIRSYVIRYYLWKIPIKLNLRLLRYAPLVEDSRHSSKVTS